MKVRITSLSELRTDDVVLPDEDGDGIFVERVVPEPPLPTAPGTIIAIGSWWFVKLRVWGERRGHPTGNPDSWELLPAASNEDRLEMERHGLRHQCVYDGSTLRTQARRVGGYTLVSVPMMLVDSEPLTIIPTVS